ncbi:hypothetical protein [Pseudothauera hydrothermalis]|uniref:hypothetical protein n=1 Tax=Pseudothauera hydrothermalis TaxID=2184083 RepID=UPI0013C33F70|nr:hypothetical protein [Pseudothauera hydrothermalis]
MLDDNANIEKNGALLLANPSDLNSILYAVYSFQPGGGTRSLAMLTFMLDYWRGGLEPEAFKATNIALHAACAVVLAALFRKILTLAWNRNEHVGWIAVAIAALWALHPLHVSTVLYAVQRMQILSTLFTLLAITTYLNTRIAQISGHASRRSFLLTFLWAGLAFLSKEDAILLPLYTAIIELTLLKFAAKSAQIAKIWRGTYLLLGIASVLLFLSVALPYFGTTTPYPGRDFNTIERLLTQTRVLWLYIFQIVLPHPDYLTFYYDYYPISRSLVNPITTLPALLGILWLLHYAWRARHDYPLRALGILWFFAGHALTSTIIPLELVFEHRNHLPLAGLCLVGADILRTIFQPSQISSRSSVVALGGTLTAIILAAGTATIYRAYQWSDGMRLAQYHANIAPDSARAWVDLCNRYYDLSKGQPDHPMLQKAIDTCTVGHALGYDAISQTNIVIYKGLQGTLSPADWENLLKRLKTVTITPGTKQIIWSLISNSTGQTQLRLDPDRVADAIKVITSRTTFSARDYLNIAYFIHNYTTDPEQAIEYMRDVIRVGKIDDPAVLQMFTDLKESSYDEWINELQAYARTQGKFISAAP